MQPNRFSIHGLRTGYGMGIEQFHVVMSQKIFVSLLHEEIFFFVSEASGLAVVPTQHPSLWVLAGAVSAGVRQ
jgi:hypothetical protein